MTNDGLESIRDFSPEFFCFLKVANDVFPALSPTGLHSFFESVNKLGESLNFSSCIIRSFTHFDYRSNLVFGITDCTKLFLRKIASKLRKSLSQDARSEPTVLQGLSERTFFSDHLVNRNAMYSRSLFQSILKDLTAHTSINDRVPVHKLDCASGQCLTELIHRGRCLLTRRTRNGSKVRNTFDSLHRSIQLNTSRCERTNVASHLSEVIDGHVGVMIQLIKRRIDLRKVRTFFLSISENRLDRVNLRLVLSKTRLHRIDGERFSKSPSERHCFCCDIRQHRPSHDIKRFEPVINLICPIADRFKVYIFSRLGYPRKAIAHVIEFQRGF